ncbi:alpha-hydroxy-acid oxidizing protein [Photobacterium kishitanii]|uniref:alpha-hydroxy-acid oxidizing protein n=1 Tax=Photobacterium kishitanii TaxID=318456 RepID=UPI0034E941AA
MDAGSSTISKGVEILNACKGQTAIMMDSGIREGSDIACTLAAGMDFTFMGRRVLCIVSAH